MEKGVNFSVKNWFVTNFKRKHHHTHTRTQTSLTSLFHFLILSRFIIQPISNMSVHHEGACLTVVPLPLPHMVYLYETNRPLCFRLILHAISFIPMATDAAGKQNGNAQWAARTPALQINYISCHVLV